LKKVRIGLKVFKYTLISHVVATYREKGNKDQSIVEKIWLNIDAELTSGAKKQSLNDTSIKTSHKAIRIFVSSTFTDFFNEREILVKQVILIGNSCYSHFYFVYNNKLLKGISRVKRMV
jgi:hypothetical protein